jgi:hypothetical protein
MLKQYCGTRSSSLLTDYYKLADFALEKLESTMNVCRDYLRTWSLDLLRRAIQNSRILLEILNNFLFETFVALTCHPFV